MTDAVTHERFNLHASVHLAAHDDLGRERLCRYLTRPAFSLARLRVRRDGNVSYRVKKATRGRVTQRVMTPVETLARLAAMVPPPRYPLLRFHGVLAPRHRLLDGVNVEMVELAREESVPVGDPQDVRRDVLGYAGPQQASSSIRMAFRSK